uniref:Immunoglobulin-binding protein 1 n=1 Tax=Anopheles atroparvus TaxID=41427 RepID=A0A182J7T6_ANOAO
MSSQPAEIPLDRKLKEIYDEAYNMMVHPENINVPSIVPEYQLQIKKCIGLFEDATRLVSLVGMFSSNESHEEVPTENLRYFLLPFYLGKMTQKLCNADREQIVAVAEVYFKDFLARCADYRLYEKPDTDSDACQELAMFPGAQSDKLRELNRMGQERNEKIRKYQEKKELDEKIEQLRQLVDRGDERVDDEMKRDFYLKLLKSSIGTAQEELESIAKEKQVLDYLKQRREGDGGRAELAPPEKKFQPKPLKPIIITRDAVQKAVYGKGYPSLPTMTVAEFYEQRVAEGIFPDPEKMKEVNKNSLMNKVFQDNAAELDREDEEKEQLVERDDEEYLARQRAKDEFKDEHRRGEGNRYNRS